MRKRDTTRVEFFPAGTNTPQGEVVWHDLTEYDLGRIAIELPGKYPELETWLAALKKRGITVKLYRYTERAGRSGTSGLLWIYYTSADHVTLTRWYDWKGGGV